MYLDLADHDAIRQKVSELKLNHYITYPSKEALEYIKSLPKTVFSMQMYEEDEYRLLKYLGFYTMETKNYKAVHDFILKYISKSYPQYEVKLTNLEIYYSLVK
jgi:hypothetical protein